MENERREDFEIPKEILEKLSDPEVLRRYVEEGRTFQEILEFDDETMEKFYQTAIRLMHAHRYADAGDAFLFLTTLNPYVAAYWLGLGMCEQLNEDYKPALVAYAMASMSDRANPLPHYHSAACHHALDDLDKSLLFLERAIDSAGEMEEHAALKARSLAAREALLAKKKQR